jgi:hypothetical protein
MFKVPLAAGRLVPLVAVIAFLALALMTGGASANAPAATISFAGNASLVSDPGPVILTLHYSCLSPSPGFIEVNLDENGIFLGGAAAEATCDGRNHSWTVTVGPAFIPGTAAGRADVTNAGGGAIASTNEQVIIK